LIDIREPGYKYSIYEYQRDFHAAYDDMMQRGKLPVLCGGSGLYVESILRGYEMHEVPENPALRKSLEGKTLEELTEILKTYKVLHNTTDTDTAKRAIREIEIQDYYKTHAQQLTGYKAVPSLVVGIDIDRETRRERISRRLRERLDAGMLGMLDQRAFLVFHIGQMRNDIELVLHAKNKVNPLNASNFFRLELGITPDNNNISPRILPNHLLNGLPTLAVGHLGNRTGVNNAHVGHLALFSTFETTLKKLFSDIRSLNKIEFAA
jgi:hypothetical protein